LRQSIHLDVHLSAPATLDRFIIIDLMEKMVP